MQIDQTLTYAAVADITKIEDDPDDASAVIVYGRATSDDLDLDDQIVDREFARKGMGEWISTYANLRQMHSPNLPPAGKGIELVEDDGGFNVRARVVEPTAVKLCREGVYAAYSIGIARPRIISDKAARNGRIVGGSIVELSLVDRPANPTCKLQLAKMAGDSVEEPQSVEELDKKAYSDDERSDMADAGEAMPDGSYPIKTTTDLTNAISSYGRAKDPDKVRAHIIARAKALDATDLLPSNWPGSTKPASKGEPVDAFVLKRLHDVFCPAYSFDALMEEYPSIAKNGVAATLGPLAMQSLYQMLLQEVQEDGGSGSQCCDVACIAQTYNMLCDYVANEAAESISLMNARGELHKQFLQVNGIDKADAPKPVDTPNPAQFRRPYITEGHAPQSATSSQSLLIHPQGRVVDASDFQRGPITAGHEADSPANKDGVTPQARVYYTNAAKDDMNAVLQNIHDHLAIINPAICPMDTPAVPPQVSQAVVFDNRDTAMPQPVSESALASAATAIKAEPTGEPMLTLDQVRELVREETTRVQANADAQISELSDMVNKMAAAPDPAQAAFRAVESGVLNKGGQPDASKADDGAGMRRFLESVRASGREYASAASDALAAEER